MVEATAQLTHPLEERSEERALSAETVHGSPSGTPFVSEGRGGGYEKQSSCPVRAQPARPPSVTFTVSASHRISPVARPQRQLRPRAPGTHAGACPTAGHHRPLPQAPGSRRDGDGQVSRGSSGHKTRIWWRKWGKGRPPSKPGHSDLMTKPIFSGKTTNTSTLTCYPPRAVRSPAWLCRGTGRHGERAGWCPLSSEGPRADVDGRRQHWGLGTCLVVWPVPAGTLALSGATSENPEVPAEKAEGRTHTAALGF